MEIHVHIKNNMKKIFLSPPHMSGNELNYIKEVFEQNWISTTGPHITKFEELVKSYVDSKYAVALNSGTSAIHLALRSLGIGKDDIVLCSSLTFIGSVNPILYESAKPVFIDSENITWNMDPVLLEQSIINLIKKNSKPKAIINVHIFGMPSNIKKIKSISDFYGIPLIEDAAESLGSTYNGKHTGTWGDIGVYSFNGNKLLSTSGGGVLVTDNKDIADTVKFLSTQAKEPKDFYYHKEIGYNYRMSNVIAAIGIGQMEVIEDRIKRTREIHEIYKNELRPWFKSILTEGDTTRSNYWLTCGVLNKSFSPSNMINHLGKLNIEARRVWNPMHNQPILYDSAKYINGTSDYLFNNGICLPSGSSMTNNDLDRVIQAFKKYKK